MFTFLFFAAYCGRDGASSFPLTFALMLLGVCIGWLTGLLASPYSEEVKRFAKYAGLLTTLLTGYVAGKLDPVLTRFLAQDPIVIDNIAAMRATAFLASIVIGTIASYAYREYLFKTQSGVNNPPVVR
jgi:hypothetical protein